MKPTLPPSALIGKSSAEGIQSLLSEGEPKPKKVNPHWPFKSKLEADYHEWLCDQFSDSPLQRNVRIWHERVTWTLVPASEHQKGVRYTPDFTIWRGAELVEVIECKGRWMDGAKEKTKALAHLIRPVPVYVVTRVKGNWERERF